MGLTYLIFKPSLPGGGESPPESLRGRKTKGANKSSARAIEKGNRTPRATS
uniref:Spermidine/putrescine ABC transporter ATP-binding protein n=1 Tax=Parascaris equorum TaxID=6256 RepID=A0A914RIJ4_PAREQ